MDDRVPTILSNELGGYDEFWTFDTPGHIKDIYRVAAGDRDLLLYLYPEQSEQKVQPEVGAFREISTKTGIQVPEVVGTDHQQYILCEYFDHQPMNEVVGELSDEQTARLGKVVGETVSELHSIKYDRFGDVPYAFHDKRMDTWVGYLSHLLSQLARQTDDQLVHDAVQILEDCIDVVEGADDPVLTHGDLHAYNMLLTDDWNVVLLDFEGCFAAPREYDVVKAIDYYTVGSSDSFLDGYGRSCLNSNWGMVRRYYDLFHATRGIVATMAHGLTGEEEKHRRTVRRYLDGGL